MCFSSSSIMARYSMGFSTRLKISTRLKQGPALLQALSIRCGVFLTSWLFVVPLFLLHCHDDDIPCVGMQAGRQAMQSSRRLFDDNFHFVYTPNIWTHILLSQSIADDGNCYAGCWRGHTYLPIAIMFTNICPTTRYYICPLVDKYDL